jgi:uncharacterized SAM-dependent methyltransferase
MAKSASILSAFEKEQRRVHYYALDLSRNALSKGLTALAQLFEGSEMVTISGLLGTYQDCTEWLATVADFPRSAVGFLWVGNSIANLTQQNASLQLAQFRKASERKSLESFFLISADCCSKRDQLFSAYDPTLGPSHTFLYNGIHNTNGLFGQEILRVADWDCRMEHDVDQNELRFSFVCKDDVQCCVDELTFLLKKGQKIPFWLSGKWSKAQIEQLAKNANLKVSKAWKHIKHDYCSFNPRP